MVDRDDEQILYDQITEGNNQYWVDDEGNADPNQYLNEEGNEEDNMVGNVERIDSQPAVGQKRASEQRGAMRKLDRRFIN